MNDDYNRNTYNLSEEFLVMADSPLLNKIAVVLTLLTTPFIGFVMFSLYVSEPSVKTGAGSVIILALLAAAIYMFASEPVKDRS